MHSRKMRDNAPCHSSDLFGTNEIGPRALFLNSGQHDSSTCTNAAPWTCGYAIAYWAAFLSQPSYSRHHMSHTAGLRNISIPMCFARGSRTGACFYSLPSHPALSANVGTAPS